MSKLKKIVLFSGIGAIALAIIIITSVSYGKYAAYRKKMDEQTQTSITYVSEV